MALKFDGNGQVNIPEFNATGDFTVSDTVTLGSTSTEIWCGYSAASTSFIGYVAGISGIRARINGTDFDSGVSVTVGQTITFSLSRTGTSVTFTVNGDDTTGNASGAFICDRFGSFNGGSGKYTGLMSGIITMTGGGGLSRTYNTDTSTGTTLTDTTLDQDGTLTGFTTGGFVASSDTITINTPAYRIWQRVGSSGSVSISLTYTGEPASIQRRVDNGSWVSAIASPFGGSATDTFNLSTGQHTIDYRFSDDTDVTGTVTPIAVGDVFACAGQSNMSGRGTNNQVFADSSGGVTAYLLGNDDTFKQLVDPYDDDTNQVDSASVDTQASGSWIVRFVNAWLASSEVPIGLIPLAKGGTLISQHQKGQDLYTSMARRIAIVGGVKAVFFQLGESDSKDTNGTLVSAYETGLNQFANDVKSDFGVNTYIPALHTITQAGFNGNGTTTGQAAIRQGQINAADNNSNIYLSAPLTDIDVSTDDGIHFQSNTNLQTVADRFYTLYTTPVINPSQPTSVVRDVLVDTFVDALKSA